MFYDKDCDGDAGEQGEPWWVIGYGDPLQVLDGDAQCAFLGRTDWSISSTTPPSGKWQVACNGAFTSLPLSITPDCRSTPAYTYEWGEWTPQQPDNTTCGGLDQRIAVEECAAGLGCCIKHQIKQGVEVRPQAPCTIESGEQPHLVLSGVPPSCNADYLDGMWQSVGQTSDGWPYYKWWWAGGKEWLYMHLTKDIDGAAGREGGQPIWIINDANPNTTASPDVEGGARICNTAATALQFSASDTPPSGAWNVTCDEGTSFTTLPLTLTRDCPTTPAYTYVWGEWTPQQSGTTCSGREHREAVEECAAGLGCCINHQETTEVRAQAPCPGDYPSIMLNGLPRSCAAWMTNGEWQYIGKTDDGRPYYRQRHAAEEGGEGWYYYMYYGKDCDGIGGGIGQPGWIIDNAPPSTTAEQVLDGDGLYGGVCDGTVRTVNTTASSTPPSSGAWYVKCSDGNDGSTTIRTLTLTPSCPNTPDYTYIWGEWTPRQTDGSTCNGSTDQRSAVEECSTGLGCCINHQPTFQTKDQAPCPAASSKRGTNAGTIVGIVVPLLLLVFIVLCLLRKKRKDAAAETIRQRAATDELMGANTVEMQPNPHAQARARSDTTHTFCESVDTAEFATTGDIGGGSVASCAGARDGTVRHATMNNVAAQNAIGTTVTQPGDRNMQWYPDGKGEQAALRHQHQPQPPSVQQQSFQHQPQPNHAMMALQMQHQHLPGNDPMQQYKLKMQQQQLHQQQHPQQQWPLIGSGLSPQQPPPPPQQQQQEQPRDRTGSTVSTYDGFGGGGVGGGGDDVRLVPTAAAGGGGGTIQRGNRKPSLYLGFEQGAQPNGEDETRL
jgi:hypothetical protein